MPDRNHAVVIGGSIAGLLAGRALANHFRRVTIVERDFFPSQPRPRPGLPQARFLHVLLKRGQLILEGFFPGFAEELLAAGVPLVEGTRLALHFSTGQAAPYQDGLDCLSFSRDCPMQTTQELQE
jgi:2-polyprenyl-6-methoxyphenol hydroxylase-like FAD-dependent oxidoreductase